MNTLILRNPSENDIHTAANLLKEGKLVVFPTETVYGLGASALDETAAARIYAAKGRPSDNPLIIHIASPEEAEPYAVTNETYYRLATQFMPGPLTVILPKKDTIPNSVTGGLDTVAVRCPAHPVARALIAARYPDPELLERERRERAEEEKAREKEERKQEKEKKKKEKDKDKDKDSADVVPQQAIEDDVGAKVSE